MDPFDRCLKEIKLFKAVNSDDKTKLRSVTKNMCESHLLKTSITYGELD